MIDFYKKLNSRDIFKYLIIINLFGVAYTVFLFGVQYLNAAYFVNLIFIFATTYLYHSLDFQFIRWLWYFYAFFTLSAVFLASPVEMFNQNGFYYVFINIPELILTTASIHKLLIEN